MVVSNTGYAISIVCANAFLPGLAKEDPAVVTAARSWEGESSHTREGDEEEQALLSATQGLASLIDIQPESPSVALSQNPEGPEGDQTQSTLLSLTMSRISSTGVGIGFFSGVTVLALLIVPVTLGGGSTASLRLAIGLSGIWWAVFTIPSWLGLPGGSRNAGEAPSISLASAWKRVGNMVSPRQMRRLPSLYTFLLAWVFLSDGMCPLFQFSICQWPKDGGRNTNSRLPHYDVHGDTVRLFHSPHACVKDHPHRDPSPARRGHLVNLHTAPPASREIHKLSSPPPYRSSSVDITRVHVCGACTAFRRFKNRGRDVRCGDMVRAGTFCSRCAESI